MIKDMNETYDLEDIIATLTFELRENMNTVKLKELKYYLWMKETLDTFEYEE